jgi:hypothetical protein
MNSSSTTNPLPSCQVLCQTPNDSASTKARQIFPLLSTNPLRLPPPRPLLQRRRMMGMNNKNLPQPPCLQRRLLLPTLRLQIGGNRLAVDKTLFATNGAVTGVVRVEVNVKKELPLRAAQATRTRRRGCLNARWHSW